MEVNTVRPAHLAPEYERAPIRNRHVGTDQQFQRISTADKVYDFSFDTLMKLADAALAGGDQAAALEQYRLVLINEPGNSRALYGSILAEGGQPNADLKQIFGKLNHLLKEAPDGERQRLLNRAGDDLLLLGKSFEANALKVFLREITPASFEQFATRMEEVLTFYQNTAHLSPTHEGTMLAMITTAERLMMPYRDRTSGEKLYPPKGIYEKGKEWLKKARVLLKEKFPSRFQRLLLYKKYQTCFIATAAWDDPFAEEVMVLRAFRDLYLKPHPLGRRFIRYYYRYGALAAAPMRGSGFLRGMVRLLLAPLVWGVEKCLIRS